MEKMFSYFKRRAERKLAEQRLIDSIDLSPAFNKRAPLPTTWMDDPDDYATLPPCPDADAVSDVVWNEWFRKWSVRVDAKNQIDEWIEGEKLLGYETPDDEREKMIQERAGRLADIRANVEWEVNREAKQGRDERQRHVELLDSIERASVAGTLKQFAREHPFLSGVLAEEVARRLRNQ